MSPAVFLGVLGVGVAAAGVAMQYNAGRDQEKAQGRMEAASRRAENERKRQMELDARRRRREVIRQQITSRAFAASAASNQGALGGSGLQGGYGQIGGRTGVGLTGISQNLEIGRNIFDANAAYSVARGQQSTAQSQANFGAGLFSLGSGMVNSMPQVASLTGGYGNLSGQSPSNSKYYGSAGMSSLY